jgi:1-aminocyclopropane-1-carboxylate synthase
MSLSKRAERLLVPSPLFEGAARAFANPYDAEKNPTGIISLGIAENALMYADIAEFLDENLKITPDLFGYLASLIGPPSLLKGLTKLYNSATFDPVVPVEAKHIHMTAGCTALLDQLFYTLCGPGDGVLIGMPLYGGFANDVATRAHAKLLPVSLKGIDPFSIEAIPFFERTYQEAKEQGDSPKALVLCTPHNPIGQ